MPIWDPDLHPKHQVAGISISIYSSLPVSVSVSVSLSLSHPHTHTIWNGAAYGVWLRPVQPWAQKHFTAIFTRLLAHGKSDDRTRSHLAPPTTTTLT